MQMHTVSPRFGRRRQDSRLINSFLVEISSLKIYAASEYDIASDISYATSTTGSITPNTTAGGPVATSGTGLATRAAWCVHLAYGALMLAFWEILAF